MATDLVVDWARFRGECRSLANRWDPRENGAGVWGIPTGVWGIPTGGSVVALQVAEVLGRRHLEEWEPGCLVVDDLVDTGATAERVCRSLPAPAQGAELFHFDALFRKPHSPPELAPNATLHDGWVRFPWENDAGDPTDAVRRLIQFIGEDPTREGLADTPARVTRALAEMTAGYRLDAGAVLATTFEVDCDEMVVLRAVPFTSLCEHHLLPFVGTITMGYIPANGRVVGLSKLARLVEVYARRLQIQERLTVELSAALEANLRPAGSGVVVRAVHSCMAARGVGKASEMVTSRLRGIMLHASQSRGEFMALAQP